MRVAVLTLPVLVGILARMEVDEKPHLKIDEKTHYYLRRQHFKQYLAGDGVEVGALHNPLDLSGQPITRIRYVDRYDLEGLRKHYPELSDWDIMPVDIVDDGQVLGTVPDASLDFVIANNMIEHTDDPLGTISNWLAKLRPGGVVYLTVPDKRIGWDEHRPLTPLMHMVEDYRVDAQTRKARNYEHFADWTTYMTGEYDPQTQQNFEGATPEETEANVKAHIQHLIDTDYSIHFHVFTYQTFLEMLEYARDELDFPLEILDKGKPVPESWESIFILQKTDSPRGKTARTHADDTVNLHTAQAVVPFLMETLSPTRVVEFGCGTGAWLSVFTEHGVERVLGVDIDGTDRNTLHIPPKDVMTADPQRLPQIKERFDLALCFSPAIPQAASEMHTLVQSLTELAPAVLFAAPLPASDAEIDQAQWLHPWVVLFAAHGYAALDSVRGRFWSDTRVAPEMVQSLLIFVDEQARTRFPAIFAADMDARTAMRSVIHPRAWRETQRHDAETVAALAQSEDALEMTQVELGRRNIALHHSDTRLWETQTKLSEINTALWKSETRLWETEGKLGGTEGKLGEAETKLRETETRLRETEGKLGETKTKLREMEIRSYHALGMENTALAELRVALATKNAHLAQLEERVRTIEGTVVPEKNEYIRQMEEQRSAMNGDVLVKAAWFLHKRRTKKQ